MITRWPYPFPAGSVTRSRNQTGVLGRGLWTIRGQDLGASAQVSRRMRETVTPHTAIPLAAPAAPAPPAASHSARSRLAVPSATAIDPAAAAPSRPAGVRYDTADTDLVGIPRRPLPARQTARSTDAPPAPYGPVEPCPAPTAPNHAQASPPAPPTARSTDSGTAHHRADAVPPRKPPYRESRHPNGTCVDREPDGAPGALVNQRNGTRHGRCNEQPTADDTRLRHDEAPGPSGLGANGLCA